jgi:hypothetical protein
MVKISVCAQTGYTGYGGGLLAAEVREGPSCRRRYSACMRSASGLVSGQNGGRLRRPRPLALARGWSAVADLGRLGRPAAGGLDGLGARPGGSIRTRQPRTSLRQGRIPSSARQEGSLMDSTGAAKVTVVQPEAGKASRSTVVVTERAWRYPH